MYSGTFPPERVYRMAEIQGLTRRTVGAVYQMIYKRQIPAPIMGQWPLTWDAHEIDQWLANGGNAKKKPGPKKKETRIAKSV